VTVNIPATIRAGDTVKWRDDASVDAFGAAVTSSTWTLTYYLRTNTASEGATITGTAYGQGWELTIAAATSAGFDAGQWYWQAIATAGSEKLTLGAGQLEVLAALNYAGTPGAFDGRSQAQQDLDAVQAAIRAMVSGGAVAEYTIGSRRLKKLPLTELLQLEAKLKSDVKREQAADLAANGLGNPHNLFVRFS
jgi:hypothetical protein